MPAFGEKLTASMSPHSPIVCLEPILKSFTFHSNWPIENYFRESTENDFV